MADKHSLNYDVRELKLGASFTNNKASQYHTIKYDFKPASVDVNKMATVDVGTNNQVTVTVPHLDGAGVPHTVFKGSQRPYTKECVLIIDRVTGEITLEKLSSNIQVKKTRQESSSKPRPLTPVTSDFTNTTQRSTSRTRVATNKRTAQAPPVGPAGQAGPAGPGGPGGPGGLASNGQRYSSQSAPNMVRSPPRQKTSPPQAPWSGGGNSTLASLPMIGFGFEDPSAAAVPSAAAAAPSPAHAPAPAPAPAPASAHAPPHNGYLPPRSLDRRDQDRREEKSYMERVQPITHMPTAAAVAVTQRVEQSSSSSSSDSGSDSGSDSDSDEDATAARPPAATANPALPTDVLNDDLCLSDTGSDSD